MRRVRFCYLLVLMIAAGCVRVPSGERYWSKEDRLAEHRFRTLRPTDGKTTRDDVIRVMGPPAQVDPSQRVMIYLWESAAYEKEYPDWLNLKPPMGERVSLVKRYVIFRFAPDGLLTRHQVRTIDSRDDQSIDSYRLLDDALADRSAD